MGKGFANSRHAMTAGAAPCHGGGCLRMIKARGRPRCPGSMAGVTGEIGQRMIGRLSFGHDAVVAACALSGDYTLGGQMLKGGTGPGRGVVACAAWHHRRNVCTGLAWRTSPWDMAQGTFLGRPAKDALDMAGLAIGPHMRAV